MKIITITVLLLLILSSSVYAENSNPLDLILPTVTDQAKSLIKYGYTIAKQHLPFHKPITMLEAKRRGVSLDNCTWKSKRDAQLDVTFCEDSATGLVVIDEVILSNKPALPFEISFGMNCSEVIELLGTPLINSGKTPASGCSSKSDQFSRSDTMLIYAGSHQVPSIILELNFSAGRLERIRWLLGG
jgi:hypothetical protein